MDSSRRLICLVRENSTREFKVVRSDHKIFNTFKSLPCELSISGKTAHSHAVLALNENNKFYVCKDRGALHRDCVLAHMLAALSGTDIIVETREDRADMVYMEADADILEQIVGDGFRPVDKFHNAISVDQNHLIHGIGDVISTPFFYKKEDVFSLVGNPNYVEKAMDFLAREFNATIIDSRKFYLSLEDEVFLFLNLRGSNGINFA